MGLNKLVSIIVVNYNGDSYVEECLESIYKQTYSPIEIIVVDNCSKDNSVEVLRKHSEQLILIESANNHGFAKGNNIGIEKAKGTYIALLNNDAIADPLWIETAVSEMSDDTNLGSVGCKIISYYDREVMDSAGLLFSVEGMSRGNGRNNSVSLFEEKFEMLIPSGCAVIYRKEALDEVGLFDEDFFCYCEDADLGLRLQLYGWTSRFLPEAIVFHRYSETAGKYSSFKAFHIERNHYWFVLKNYPLKYVLLNPFYTIGRYVYQLKGMLSNQGATSEYVKSASPIELVKTLLKAHIDIWKHVPSMLRKRRKIQRDKKVPTKTFDTWLVHYRITLNELFKD